MMTLNIYKSDIVTYKLKRSGFFKLKFKRFFRLKNLFYKRFLQRYLKRGSFLKWNIKGNLIYKEFIIFSFLWTQNRIKYFKRLKKLSFLPYKKGYRFDLYSKISFGKFLKYYRDKTKEVNSNLVDASVYNQIILKKKNKKKLPTPNVSNEQKLQNLNFKLENKNFFSKLQAGNFAFVCLFLYSSATKFRRVAKRDFRYHGRAERSRSNNRFLIYFTGLCLRKGYCSSNKNAYVLLRSVYKKEGMCFLFYLNSPNFIYLEILKKTNNNSHACLKRKLKIKK